MYFHNTFHGLKLQTALILKLTPSTFFVSAKTICALVDTNPLLIMKMVAKSNTCTCFCCYWSRFSHQVCTKCNGLENTQISNIEARNILKREVSGWNRRMGVVLLKQKHMLTKMNLRKGHEKQAKGVLWSTY